MLYNILLAATMLLHAVTVHGQSSASVDLAGIISQAAGLASALSEATPTPSSTSASSSASTSMSSFSTVATSSAASSSPAAAATSSAASSSPTAAASSDGLDPHTRTIIIAVCVPVGLLLLGILIGCLACCCIRRRRRNRRVASPEVAAVGGRNDWSHENVSHHGYVSSESDVNRHPRIPTGAAVRDSAPLMAEDHEKAAPMTTVHPAYRTNSWGSSGNANAQNPFTPTPPIARKPVPNSQRNGHPVLAAGAGAALGAAAAHHHHKKHEEHGHYNSAYRPLSSHPAAENPFADEQQERDFRDPNRPPTPFGLNAFGIGGKRRSKGDIEPSVAAHSQGYPNSHAVEGPTEAQRRSLQEREMLGAEPPVPERSPKRTSFNTGYSPVESNSPRPAIHDPTYASNDSGTSNESWQSAQVAHTQPQPQPQQNHWDDAHQYLPEPRHSEDHGYSDIPLVAPHAAWNGSNRNSGESTSSWMRRDSPRRMYGPDGNPRRSYGPDGKPRRLRFSDLQPQEYYYDYDGGHHVGQAL